MGQRTKNQLAKALMELSRTKSIDDISVRDITDHCELVRNSFYYHFQDKQDLMKYIYMAFRETLKFEDGYQKENTINFINYMRRYPYFFRQAFKRDEQNGFREELLGLMREDYLTLLAKKDNQMPEHTQQFMALFYAYATVGMFEYVINHEEVNLDEIAEDFEIAMQNRVV